MDDGEDLARFLTQSGHYKQQKVLPSAFLPSTKDRATSVSRHGGEPLERLKTLGVAAANGRALHGAAIFKASDARLAGLEVNADEPPERHALVKGWPWVDSDPQFQKAQQKEKALQLASAAGVPLLFGA
ncbi:hypothetical protein [Thiomonas sp. X19]|uniref:hypothetical protein n=1 Tax=Thiomonas sp. X19 TaxID=1050370 RepID=UPI0011BE6F8D|nr:hypothetical protein [Thiomonas sp. X19]